MTDQTRYKAWRSGPEPELDVIVYEGAELPRGISSLGPWLGSHEGEIANMKPHYRAMLDDTGFVVGHQAEARSLDCMAVLKAYLDDSGDPDNSAHTYLTVAGYVAELDAWKYFEQRWHAVLTEAQVPYLHMREFGNPNSGIYQHLKADRDKEIGFMADLAEVIDSSSLELCPMTTIKLADLAVFNDKHGLDLDPHALAIYGCLVEMRRLYKWRPTLGAGDIEVVVDRIDKAQLRINRALEYARTDVESGTYVDTFAVIPVSDPEGFRKVLPLQAADFISWEMRKSCEDRKTWEYTAEERRDIHMLRRSYSDWAERHRAETGKPPRVRKSYKALRRVPVLAPQGYIWDEANLEAALERHPNGWCDSN
jgi:hypothetical protein